MVYGKGYVVFMALEASLAAAAVVPGSQFTTGIRISKTLNRSQISIPLIGLESRRL